MRVTFRDADGDDFEIPSTRGVSQGCPLSPALFQLVMSDVVREIRRKYGICFSYLDDNTIILTSVSHAIDVLEIIKRDAAKVGLELNLSKCVVFWVRGSTTSTQDLCAWERLVGMSVRRTTEGIRMQ